MRTPFLFLSTLLNHILPLANGREGVTFALIPKFTDHIFFRQIEAGCLQAASRLDVECLYIGPKNGHDVELQTKLVRQLAINKTVDGIAISVSESTPAFVEAIREASHHLPIITFDSDAPESDRLAYVGTDNYFFGLTMGKALQQLRPEGGVFAIWNTLQPNIMERVRGVRDSLSDYPLWREASTSPSNSEPDMTLSVPEMSDFALQGVDAILPVLGAPSRQLAFRNFSLAYPNLTFVSGDAFPDQLSLLSENLIHGLVGQLPFEMGTRSIYSLWDLYQGQDVSPTIGTNVLTHIIVPLELPELQVNHNIVGNLSFIGYSLFGVTTLACTSLTGWVFRHRKQRVVQVAQPRFLYMVLTGVFILSASMIPLSLDENSDDRLETSPYQTDAGADRHMAICMSIPWLSSVGFTVAFSALLSKTLRVNRIFRSNVSFARIKVTERDVLKPFLILIAANVLILICWTVIDPLVYTRKAHLGTDGWQRVISTYGTCESEHTSYYMIPLILINVVVLLLANWQAYQARSLETEFSEAKWIAVCIACVLQVTLMGVPTVFVVTDNPPAFYLVCVFGVFIVCWAILLAIFVPKVMATLGSSPDEQAAKVDNAVQKWSRRQSEIQLSRASSLRSTRAIGMNPSQAGKITEQGSSMALPSESLVDDKDGVAAE